MSSAGTGSSVPGRQILVDNVVPSRIGTRTSEVTSNFIVDRPFRLSSTIGQSG